jgi:hypothetical protein
MEVSIQYFLMCMWVPVETDTYTWGFLSKGSYTLKSVIFKGHTVEQTVSGLSIVVFLLVGHYPYYESIDLTIIKASKY